VLNCTYSCYRQVLPITTIAVQKAKPAESIPSSNPFKRIQTNHEHEKRDQEPSHEKRDQESYDALA